MSACASPSGQPVHQPPSPLDVLAEELGAVAGQIERDTALRISAAIADFRQAESERELRYLKLERRIEERLASLKDGAQGERGEQGPAGERGEQGLQGERGATGEAGPKGDKGDAGDRGEQGPIGPVGDRGERGEQGIAGPVGERGEKGDQGERGETGERGERGDAGPQGDLPVAIEWADKVHRSGQVVTHAGSLFQATRDTGKEPPHADWICVAAAGRNGEDGRSFDIVGTYKTDGKYLRLNVVSLNGASFAARRDDPGPCPGEGWQLIAMQGGRGKPGERGLAGPKGEAGPKIENMAVNGDGLLTVKNADGSRVECDLYPLLSKLG